VSHPLKPEAGPVTQVRAICLALPEATERIAWGEPTWRVRDKIFAQYDNNHHNAGRIAIWCKSTPEAQDMYVRAGPERYFVPPYVGHKGWIGVRLDVDVDWGAFEEIVTEAWRLTAPKRLLAPFDESRGEATAAGATRPARRRSPAAGSRRRRSPRS